MEKLKPMKTKQSKSEKLARTRSLPRSLPTYTYGQMFVLALATTTLVGVMALGADVAVLYYNNWGKLQRATDAGGLAGASYPPTDTDTATSTAKTGSSTGANSILRFAVDNR